MFAKVILVAIAAAAPLTVSTAPAFADAAADRVWAELRGAGAGERVPFTRHIDFDGPGLTSTEVGGLVDGLSSLQVARLERACGRVVGGGFSVDAVSFCRLYRAEIRDNEENEQASSN